MTHHETAAAIEATQKYLASGKSLEDFEIEHGIRSKTDGQHLILDYNQITVDWNKPYGRVCRGLVLDAKTFDVIGFGLPKFHNAGTVWADPLDWDTTVVFEKVDGTLVNRWWSPHTNQFEITTRFQLPGDVKKNTVLSGLMTWEVLIRSCLATLMFTDQPHTALKDQPQDETWAFECCSPHNQVVVHHHGFSAKLLARRNNRTLKEIPVAGHPWAPRHFSLRSSDEILTFINTVPANEMEGTVPVDAHENRQKFKSDDYVQQHKLKDGLQSVKQLILIARENDYEEIILKFPQYKEDLDLTAGLIEDCIRRHQEEYAKAEHIEAQKDFAIHVNALGLEYTGSLFLTRAKKVVSIRHAFDKMIEPAFIKLFKGRVKALLGSKYVDEEEVEQKEQQ